jgi:Cu/Ag efflux pump CusA
MSPLIRLSLRFGSVVILAVILLFSVGIWAATQLQQDLLPNISVPSSATPQSLLGSRAGSVNRFF